MPINEINNSDVTQALSNVAETLSDVSKSFTSQVGQSGGHTYVSLDSNGKLFSTDDRSKRLPFKEVTRLVKEALADQTLIPEKKTIILSAYANIKSHFKSKPIPFFTLIFDWTAKASKASQVKEANDILREAGFQNEEKMNPKELIKLLRTLTRYEWKAEVFENAYNEYGAKITDAKFLLSQIEKIEDPSIKKRAITDLFDYQTNLLGHEFGLGGTLKQKSWDSKVRDLGLEGNTQSNTHLKLAQSVKDFSPHHPDMIDSKLQKSIVDAFESTAPVREIKKWHGGKIDLDKILDDIKAGKTVPIPTGWSEHGTSIAISGDKLVYSNRGQAFKEWKSGIQIYTINNPQAIDREFLIKLIDEEGPDQVKERMDFLENKNSKTGMHQLLKLHPLYFIPKKDQKVGNCAWASAKCGLQAHLFLHELNKISSGKNLEDVKIAKEWIRQLRENIAERINKGENIEQEEIRSSILEGLEEKIKDNPRLLEDLKDLWNSKLSHHFSGNLDDFEGALQKIECEIANKNSLKIYKSWNINVRKSEFEYFVDFLKNTNKNNEILSKGEELKFIGELLNKFFTIGKKERYDELVKQAGQAMQDLALKLFKDKVYNIEDGIISLQKIESSEERNHVTFLILEKKLPGAFIITQESENGGLELHYCHTQEKLDDESFMPDIRSIAIEHRDGKYYIENQLLTSMQDVSKFIQNKLNSKDYVAVPVFNQKIIDKAITQKKGLD